MGSATNENKGDGFDVRPPPRGGLAPLVQVGLVGSGARGPRVWPVVTAGRCPGPKVEVEENPEMPSGGGHGGRGR